MLTVFVRSQHNLIIGETTLNHLFSDFMGNFRSDFIIGRK